MILRKMKSLEDLEQRIRGRGVRVEERLALVRLVDGEDGQAELDRRRKELLDRVVELEAEVRKETIG